MTYERSAKRGRTPCFVILGSGPVILLVILLLAPLFSGCVPTESRPNTYAINVFSNGTTIRQTVTATATSHTPIKVDAKLQKGYSARDRKALDRLIEGGAHAHH
jgi:hypothetical protein